MLKTTSYWIESPEDGLMLSKIGELFEVGVVTSDGVIRFEFDDKVAKIIAEFINEDLCWCRACHPTANWMIACPDCGRDYCPKAHRHNNNCEEE